MLIKLKSLNSGKAPGPDGLANWILKEYADILASPISTLLNVSYNEQKLHWVGKEQISHPSLKRNRLLISINISDLQGV